MDRIIIPSLSILILFPVTQRSITSIIIQSRLLINSNYKLYNDGSISISDIVWDIIRSIFELIILFWLCVFLNGKVIYQLFGIDIIIYFVVFIFQLAIDMFILLKINLDIIKEINFSDKNYHFPGYYSIIFENEYLNAIFSSVESKYYWLYSGILLLISLIYFFIRHFFIN